MDIIKWAIQRPVAVTVFVILVVLFGIIGVGSIPIQLTPTVDRPVITVQTLWQGRDPQEIIDAVTRPQEEQLKSVPNLRTMRSVSRQGANEITLEFILGTDIRKAMQETSEALRRVPSYPAEVKEPTVQSTEGTAQSAIAWLIVDLDPQWVGKIPGFEIASLYTPLDKQVKPFLERTEGVARVDIFGGRERQMQVELDPNALAQRGLSYQQVVAALQGENADTSAGTVDEGKRELRVRVLGRYDSPKQIEDTVIAYREGRPVYVRDVGKASVGLVKADGFVRSMGQPCIAMPVIRQGGANVMKVMEELRKHLDEVRTEILPRLDPAAGAHLRLRQVYDETTYIDAAINLVKKNVWEGGVLSIITLLIFLRSIRATGVIALAIPISIIGTFLVVLAAGRTLNVISLAGMAFATGMVVDDAIVVLENIMRRRAMGDAPGQAVYRGAKEVWTAVLASTLTTVVVFIPLLTIREEAGQLFFDLTLALAVSVLISMCVAITVIPSACGVLFGTITKEELGGPAHKTGLQNLFGLATAGAGVATGLAGMVYWLITGWRAVILRPLVIVFLVVGSYVASAGLVPKLDYLPNGNQNLVFGGMLIPPGVSVAQQVDMAERLERALAPYVAADIKKPETLKALPPIPRFDAAPNDPIKVFQPVPLDQFFIGAFNGGMFIGGTSQDPQRVRPIANLLTIPIFTLPDTYGGAAQNSIFTGAGGGADIRVEISGPEINRVAAAAGMMLGIAMPQFAMGSVQPEPANFSLQQNDIQIRLSDRGRELGLRSQDVGLAVRAMFDGAFAGEFTLEGRTIDMVVVPVAGRVSDATKLGDVPIVTPAGLTVPLASVATILPGKSPQEVHRIEELPSVTIKITPPQDRPLEDVMTQIREGVIKPAQQAGLLDRTMRVRMEGSAAKLTEVRGAMFGNPASGPPAAWQGVVRYVSFGLMGVAGVFAVVCFVKGAARKTPRFAYGVVGALLLGAILAGLLLALAVSPHLLMARFIWALLVCYLLMCALFESFLYPLVIMFSVPPAAIGGFGALRLVSNWTHRHPEFPQQNLDVLTMIGFFVLIGIVVKNAILLVEQTLNFIDPTKAGESFAGEKGLEPFRAIQESVRTRLRPVVMTTMTTVLGGLPLVLAPGAGSEMYRGFGAVVCGGLLTSTVFTLVLVPLVLSLVFDMKAGISGVFAGRTGVEAMYGRKMVLRTEGAANGSLDGHAR